MPRVRTKEEETVRELLNAATKGDLAKVKSIAETGFDMQTPDVLGFTALDNAASEGHLDIVRYLVDEKGADPRKSGWITTPLLSAVASLKYDVASLKYDVASLKYDVALFLIGKGATMDDKAPVNDDTPLDYARRRRGAEKFMDLFISQMDDKRQREEFFKAADPAKAVPRADREDWLQIHRHSYINVIAGFTRLAAWDGGLDFVKALSAAGADIFATDSKGRTAEKIAAEAGNTAIADYLAAERITRSVAAVKKGTGAAISAPEKAVFKRRALAV